MTNFMAVEQLVQKTVERTGHLEYIFNKAGIGIGGNVNHYGIENWNQKSFQKMQKQFGFAEQN